MSLADFDRVPLLFGRSPLHRLERLSTHLGGGVELWAKREDCNSGLAYGGNKVRKLACVKMPPRSLVSTLTFWKPPPVTPLMP